MKNNRNDFVIENNVLKKYVGNDKIVRIPDGVKIVGYKSFKNCDWIRKVILPDSLNKIEEYAFSGCENLYDLKFSPLILLPLIKIESRAFEGCKKLVDENGFVIVNNVLFNYFGNDEVVKVPDNVTMILDGVFEGCTWIKKAILPEGLKWFGGKVFKNCDNLESIYIPSNINIRGSDNFKGCKKLADENGFVIVNNVLFDYFGNDEVVKVPDNVTIISYGVFEGCTWIKKAILPEGLKWFSGEVFKNCVNLESINIPSNIVLWGNDNFKGCNKLADENGFFIDNNVLIKYFGKDRIIRIPDGITSINFDAFDYCESMEFVVIPTSIKEIDEVCGISDLTIICAEDSYAAEYAERFDIPCIEIPEDEFQVGLTQEDIEEYIEEYQKEKEGLSL